MGLGFLPGRPFQRLGHRRVLLFHRQQADPVFRPRLDISYSRWDSTAYRLLVQGEIGQGKPIAGFFIGRNPFS